jgi:DNA recombination protein RmuC
MQSLVRDARIREEARVIQMEVGRLLEDVTRLSERVAKLDTHFRQAQEDVAGIRTSAERITRRGERIAALEFEEGEAPRTDWLRGASPALRAVDEAAR